MYITEDETYKDLEDEVILSRSINEPDLFVYIVRRYEAAFIRKAKKVLWSNEDVEDVVQETFTKIYLNAGRFKKVEGASFKSWGYTVLMNTAFTKYRKVMKGRERTADLEPEHYESLPDNVFEESFGLEMRDAVFSVLVKMPEHLSRVLEMHFIKGLPQQDIAEQEGVSVGAIKTRVHRAKAQFKKLAEEYSPFV
jgi:RNA polymerase sigma-70 factor (ECF subfamily)